MSHSATSLSSVETKSEASDHSDEESHHSHRSHHNQDFDHTSIGAVLVGARWYRNLLPEKGIENDLENRSNLEEQASELSQDEVITDDDEYDEYDDTDEIGSSDDSDDIDDHTVHSSENNSSNSENDDDESADYRPRPNLYKKNNHRHDRDIPGQHHNRIQHILSSLTKGQYTPLGGHTRFLGEYNSIDTHHIEQVQSESSGSDSDVSEASTTSERVHNITISWDQTREGHFHIERLQTVLGRAHSPASTVEDFQPRTDNHALQDYQMQLMLLEQQNKKRLLMARQQQQQQQQIQIHLQQQRLKTAAADNSQQIVLVQTLQEQKRKLLQMSPPVAGNHHSDGPADWAINGFNSQPVTRTPPPEVVETIESLRERISKLEAEKKASSTNLTGPQESSIVPIFYNIGHDGLTYIGKPRWSLSPKGKKIVLQGTDSIGNLETYLQYNSQSPFVVVRTYEPEISKESMLNQVNEVLKEPQHVAESIMLVTSDMKDAMKAFLQSQESLPEGFVNQDMNTGVIEAPYLFWYHLRSSASWDGLDPSYAHLIQKLTAWIEEHYLEEYAAADTLFQKGLVTFSTIKYLVKPGDVLLQGYNKKEIRAFMATGWPMYKSWSQPPRRREKQIQDNTAARDWRWEVPSWDYDFVGKFYRVNHNSPLVLKVANMEDEALMTDLNLFPLRFAGEKVRNMLHERGQRFWNCRKRHLISYVGSADKRLAATHDRYMIDYATYTTSETKSSLVNRLKSYEKIATPALINNEDFPSTPDTYLFPPEAIAYNLRRKKWVDLNMNSVCDVTWNKRAFDYLVLDDETKELVLALVTNNLATEVGADLIENKGKGLIMLLHGGPGTGKTLTAESVAEIAEKPLFRVTCADIGTKPEIVEKYLESVLHLAKIWDCVVLLDEADVFLEQRTLNDLARNALVSVFLRILEYFEGILILTSNRVGTFDEAFKSRIQLSLHYENLSKSQRHKIWKNFFKQLRMIPNVNIDFDDVDCSIEELAQYEMNGREIRNAITTARQLAQFKKRQMTTMHLKHVIRVGSKFDTYLKTVQEGLTPDEIARGEGLR